MLDLERATPLLRSQSVTEREFETRRATQREASGVVGAAEALLKQAEPDPDRPGAVPIDARIPDRRVDAGNLITGA